MQALDNKQEEEIEVSSIYISKIEDIRKNSGKSDTPGLSNSEIFTFRSSSEILLLFIDSIRLV